MKIKSAYVLKTSVGKHCYQDVGGKNNVQLLSHEVVPPLKDCIQDVKNSHNLFVVACLCAGKVLVMGLMKPHSLTKIGTLFDAVSLDSIADASSGANSPGRTFENASTASDATGRHFLAVSTCCLCRTCRRYTRQWHPIPTG